LKTARAAIDHIRLDGKTALVTGAAAGLGQSMAHSLLAAGANVVFADISPKVADAAQAAQEAHPGAHVHALLCNISIRQDCARVVQSTIDRFGGLDIVVNNAGKGPAFMERAAGNSGRRFWESDPDAWAEVIETNVCGAYFIAHYAAPIMIARGWGRIVNVTTSLATMQRGANSPYGVSKAAIEAETLIWSKDLSGTGVTCNSLIPGGAVDTEFVSPAMRAASAGEGRKLLPVEIMNDVLLWLASPLADNVNGARYVGKNWEPSLPLEESAAQALEAPVLRLPDRA
jgi:NAD(P)-dependent dehydrogenase (short-subunit alcohol dehydrogenase family)